MEFDYNSYKEYLLTSRKLSKATYEAYISDLDKFFQYCSSAGIAKPEAVKTADLTKYIKHLKNDSLSDSTINRTISSIKSYYRFLYQNNAINYNITTDFKPVTAKNATPEILEREEVLRLLEAPSGESVKTKRDRVMLEMLYATGMKVSELTGILLENVNLRFNIVKISSGKHERTVPIYPDAAAHLSEYIKIFRPAIADGNTDLLFTNLNGSPLSRQGVWKIIKQYAEKAGIDKTITPQTLRHSFAVHLLENGADINDIKEMMGHLDISSTMYYSNLLKNKFNKGYAKYHPLSK